VLAPSVSPAGLGVGPHPSANNLSPLRKILRAEHGALNQAYPVNRGTAAGANHAPVITAMHMRVPCEGKESKKTAGGALIWFGSSGRSPPLGCCEARAGANAAMLQLARRPAITGFGFCTARAAASGSRKMTCGGHTDG